MWLGEGLAQRAWDTPSQGSETPESYFMHTQHLPETLALRVALISQLKGLCPTRSQLPGQGSLGQAGAIQALHFRSVGQGPRDSGPGSLCLSPKSQPLSHPSELTLESGGHHPKGWRF